MTAPHATSIPLASGAQPAHLADGDVVDVLVIGAGGAGLSAAVYATIAGLSTAVIEHTELIGGTTAYTAGTTWIPGNRHAADVDEPDSRADAARFLDASVGPHSPSAVRDAFLDLGGEAVTVMEQGSHVTYRARKVHPDYLTELPGSRTGGRAIEPIPFDGALLGARLHLVRPPTPEFTAFGGMLIERDDIGHLLGAHDAEASRTHLLRLRRRYRDALRTHGADTRRTMGNALISGLLHTLDERGAPVLTRSRVTAVEALGGDLGFRVRIEAEGAASCGAASCGAAEGAPAPVVTEVEARNLVFASGGFNRHPERRAELLPGHDAAWCPGAPGHTGEAHDLVDELGGRYGRAALAHTYYAPVSRRQRADGSWAVFPHFVMDRAKPHMLVVDRHGHRFLNESTSYHLFGLQMVLQQHERPGSAAPAFLITDATGMRRYGLGMVRPFARERVLRAAIDEGYLVRADSIPALAEHLDLPADELAATVARTNGWASRGEDPEFHRGSNAYQRVNGDPASETGHPNVAPVDGAPYYAVRLYPGDIGAATGYTTDAAAAVLRSDGERIGGVYAVGNDMQSVMGGTYPAPGITIGPGLVFAYAAVRDIVGAALPGAELHEPLPGWE